MLTEVDNGACSTGFTDGVQLTTAIFAGKSLKPVKVRCRYQADGINTSKVGCMWSKKGLNKIHNNILFTYLNVHLLIAL